MKAIGAKIWAIADGYIPAGSHGKEPEMLSHEAISFLNTSDREARVEVMIYFSDREPVGPFVIRVPARRTLHQRINNLKDPMPIPIATDYAILVTSDVEILVQQTRLDSRQAENGLFSTMAYPVAGTLGK